MAVYPYQFINTRGIPTIESTGVNVGTDAVTFTFNSNSMRNTSFRGLVLIKFAQEIASGTTTTLPIQLTSPYGGTKTATKAGGANLTVADLATQGIHLFYYDRLTDVLQIIA